MTTVANFTCNKDSRTATSGGTDLGAGVGNGLPYGVYSGYTYRSFLGFSINMAGWTGINSATLNYRTSNQIYVAFGSDPTFDVARVTTAWSEGSSSGMSTSNAIVYPGPTAAGSPVMEDAPTSENTWGSVDITQIMRDVLGGAAFTGLRIRGVNNDGSQATSSSQTGEIYSRESGSAAYITISYETNRPPNAPTIASPDVANGGLVGTQTPSLQFTLTDPDGNNLLQYRYQIDDNSDFSSPFVDTTVPGTFANGSVQTVAAPVLTRGGTYYVRVQAADASVWGAWSGTFSFKVASLPTLTVSEPSGAGRLAYIQYAPGAGWVTPRMVVNWQSACPDGGSQASFRVEVALDVSGGPSGYLLDSGTVGGGDQSRRIDANLTEGNYYHVQVTTTCSHGLSTTVAWRRVRTRWGMVTHQYDMGAAVGSLQLTTLDVTDQSNGGSGQVVVEYMTGSTTALPATWAANIGGAGLNRYLNYRTWLLIWGASPAVSPTLNELRVTYPSATSVITPDKWVFNNSNQTGDVSAYVYGTKSMKLTGAGIVHWVQQQIAVAPNTNYMLSGRVQSQGDSGAYMDLATVGGTSLISTPTKHASVGFEDPNSRIFPIDASGKPQPWFSGNNTAVLVRCIVAGAVGTVAWFDAIKLEASSVVTPWSPGYVANAVILDAGGLQIDGSNGGIFRLRGNSGGIRDLVELGNNGLKFGGDTDLYSDLAGVLTVPPLDGFGMYGLRAATWVTGGGLCTFDSSANFKWASRFIVIAQGNGADSAATGYYDINCPLSGTVQGVGGHANVTATANGIPMDIWSALYVVLPKGGANTAIDVTSFRIVNYAGAMAPPPSNWVLLALYNGDAPATLYVANGLRMQTNQSLAAGGGLDVRGNVVVNGGLGVGQAAPGSGAISAAAAIYAAGNIQSGSGGIYEGSARLIQPAGLRILMGSVTTSHSAAQVSNQVAITFSPAFSGVPFVAAMTNNFNYFGGANGTAPSASGFTYATYRASGVATATIVSTWIAIGPA